MADDTPNRTRNLGDSHGYVNVVVNPLTRLEKERENGNKITFVSSADVSLYDAPHEEGLKNEDKPTVYEPLRFDKKTKHQTNTGFFTHKRLIIAFVIVCLASITISGVISYIIVKQLTGKCFFFIYPLSRPL